MVKRGKLGKELGSKGKSLKGSMSKGFNKVIKGSKKKRIIIGGILISVLSFSLVGYFQEKSALASNYKLLKISENPENINSVTAYSKVTDGEEINVLFLGDESYLGDVVLEEDIKTFIENTYTSKVNLTNISEDDASIYEQLNEYINLEDREFDLVFLCFENSDEKEISKTNFSGIYESILRDLKYNNTSVDIVPIIKHNTVVNDTYYQIINGLSKYYDLELAKVNENVLNNDVEGENIEDFKESYSTTIVDIIENNVENKKEINTEYKEVCYGVTTLFEPYKITIKGDKKKGFSVSQSEAKSNAENDYIKYKVEGNIVGLGYETNKNGGIIEVYVNRVLYRRIDTKSDVEELKYVLISSNLTEENEIKIVNNNGGDVTLLGIISSGDNTDSKEVENLNNILARNTGNYNAQKKNTSLYKDAKIESNETVTSKKESSTATKSESTVKPSTNTQSKPNTSSDNNINTVPKKEVEAEKKPVESIESNDVIKDTKPIENNQSQSNENINNGGSGNTNISGNGGGNEGNNIGSNNVENNTGSTNSGVNNNSSNNINNGGNNIAGGNVENNATNSTVNNGGNNSGNGVVDSGNSNIGNGGNNSTNNSGNNSTNNNVSNGGNSNQNNNGGESVGNQVQENVINSSAQNSERVNNEGSSVEIETTPNE